MIPPKENAIDYIEIPTTDLQKDKDFFGRLFGWQFTDYGPSYSSFADGRLNGGFYQDEKAPLVSGGSVLVVFYTKQLEGTLQRCRDLGATVMRDTFSFPGGRRFHIASPGGGEFAIWSDA